MGRRAFNLTAGLSLLLFLAVSVLWGRNVLGHRDSVTLTAARKWSVGTVNGQLAFETIHDRRGYFGETAPYATRWRLACPGELHEPNARYLGCNRFQGTTTIRAVFISDEGWTSTTYSYLAPPLWLVAMVTSVLPLVQFLTAVRRSRLTVAGCSAGCGYDLRATPSRCPECGASVEGGR